MPIAPRTAAPFALMLAAALTLTGCADTSTGPGTEDNSTYPPEAEHPITIDNCGTTVTFEAPPESVVAIKSTSVEMMLALGLEDRILGIAFPDGPFAEEWADTGADLHLISDRVPGQEATLELEPDLVYAGWESNVTADGAGDRDTLHSLGVNTFVSPAACQSPGYQPNPLTFDDVFAEIELVGSIFGVNDRARALVESQRETLTGLTPDARGLTALWYSSGDDIPYVGGGIGAPQMLMDAVGLVNIGADVDATWSSMSWEAIAAEDPDVLVLVDSPWNSAETKIERLESNPATAALTAVANSSYLIVPFAATEAGVRNVEAARTLLTQLEALPTP